MSSGSRVRLRGHDRDVVESVCPAAFLAASNLYLHRSILAVVADEKTPLAAGPMRAAHARANVPCRLTAAKWTLSIATATLPLMPWDMLDRMSDGSGQTV